MAWLTAATIGSAIVGGGASYLAGNAQAKSADQAASLTNDQYLQSRQDLSPWRASGVNALDRLNALNGLPSVQSSPMTAQSAGYGATPLVSKLYANQSSRGQTPLQDIQAALALGRPVSDASWAQAGFGPGGAGYYQAQGQAPGAPAAAIDNSPDAINARRENAMSQFRADPGYQYAVEEGQKAQDRYQAAHGTRLSGGAALSLQRHRMGLADQQYNTFYNRLASLAGIGQTATAQTAQLGSAAASNEGNALMNAGNARASGYAGIAGAANQGVGNYLYANAMKNYNQQPYASFDGTQWTPGPNGFPA